MYINELIIIIENDYQAVAIYVIVYRVVMTFFFMFEPIIFGTLSK